MSLTTSSLRDFWYPISESKTLRKGDVVGLHILGDPICLARDKNGRVACFSDRCAHRSAPLSIGRFVDEELECKYHGWKYNIQDGVVTHIPALLKDRKIPTNAKVYTYPIKEKNGLIWIWPGDKQKADPSDILNLSPNFDKKICWSDVSMFSFDLDVINLSKFRWIIV
jgi:phenylpropionate dioxygenase-like ring-hydroxylating dioxygenase large terminal subunit